MTKEKNMIFTTVLSLMMSVEVILWPRIDKLNTGSRLDLVHYMYVSWSP